MAKSITTPVSGRLEYIIKCIESVSFFAGSSFTNDAQIQSVCDITHKMLCAAWKTEYCSNIGHPFGNTNFWDAVSKHFQTHSQVKWFRIIENEYVNPTGERGNIYLCFRPANTVIELSFLLTLRDNTDTIATNKTVTMSNTPSNSNAAATPTPIQTPVVEFEYPDSDTGKMKVRYLRVVIAYGDYIKGYELDSPLSKKDGQFKTFSRNRLVRNGVALVSF